PAENFRSISLQSELRTQINFQAMSTSTTANSLSPDLDARLLAERLLAIGWRTSPQGHRCTRAMEVQKESLSIKSRTLCEITGSKAGDQLDMNSRPRAGAFRR